MNSLEIVDKILEFLKNRVASINEICNLIKLEQEKLLKLLELLETIGLIEVEEDKIKITDIGLKYLELPCEGE